jgi:hypothetical protein
MSRTKLEIEITRQGWVDPELDEDPADLCSHGEIRLEIGGEVIAPGPDDGDYTISTSALALLRTLETDHSPEQPVADRLILHCGMIHMLTCPIGIDWRVEHLGGRVRLSDVRRYESTDGEPCSYAIEVELSDDEYRREIVAFAEKAKEPFANSEKTPADEYDEQVYREFWREYEERLRGAR